VFVVRCTPSKSKTYHQPTVKDIADCEPTKTKKSINFSTEEDVVYDPLIGTKADRKQATWEYQNTEDNYEREELGPWTPHSPSPNKSSSYEALHFQMTKAGLAKANANKQHNNSNLPMPLDYHVDAGYFEDALQSVDDAYKPSYLKFGVLEIGEYNTRLAIAPLRATRLIQYGGDYFEWKGSVKILMASGKVVLHEKSYIGTISDRYVQFVAETGITSVRGHSYSFSKLIAKEFHVKKIKELLSEEKELIPSRETLTKLCEEYVASQEPEPEQSPGPPTSSIDFLPNSSSPDARTKTLFPETPTQPVTKPNAEMSQFQREQIELPKERMKFEKQVSLFPSLRRRIRYRLTSALLLYLDCFRTRSVPSRFKKIWQRR
jgi:hypothetical protein